MKTKAKTFTFQTRLMLFLLLIGGLIYASGSIVHSAETPEQQIKRGAQLYDKWYSLNGTKVTGNHPLYPASGKKNGANTWRCKECHGWDYIGKDGRYARGSHYTGIVGIQKAGNKSPDEIFRILSDSQHAFNDKITASDLSALAEFIKNGQVNMAKAIDKNGQGSGNMKNGARQYTANCANCHGVDGNDLDFKSSKEGVQGVGWLANDNPQETLHKILWGHPGSAMPSLIADTALTEQDAIDILTFSQSL